MYASSRKAKACSSGRRSACKSRRAGANAKAKRAGMRGSPCSPPSAWVMRCACPFHLPSGPVLGYQQPTGARCASSDVRAARLQANQAARNCHGLLGGARWQSPLDPENENTDGELQNDRSLQHEGRVCKAPRARPANRQPRPSGCRLGN